MGFIRLTKDKRMTRKEPNLWLYGEEVIDKFWSPPTGSYGFVYLITNCINTKKYIGRKSFYRWRYRNNKKYQTGTNWRKYMGSSKDLKEDITQFGVKHFKREILELARSSYHLSYLETKYLFKNEVIESDKWYNHSILGKFYDFKLF